MQIKNVAFALLLVSIGCFAQEDTTETKKNYGKIFGGFESTSAYYLDDKTLGDFTLNDRFRSNNYLNLNYEYKQFSAGLQVEGYEPNALLNYNPKYKGTEIATYYAAYKNKYIEATLGYFYEQFGSGLLLRTWEDRQLGINNSLRGARVVIKPSDNLIFKALYGQQRSGFDVSEGKIFGFDADVSLSAMLGAENFDYSFGLSYVGRNEPTTLLNPAFDETTNAFSGRFNLGYNTFYFSTEYNYKAKDVVLKNNTLTNDFVKEGSAILVNFGYTQKSLGIDVSLRRIENFSILSERLPETVDIENTSLNYNDMILNYTPALTKQHHSNLANIYVFQAQNRVSYDATDIMKAGETGGQIDVFYSFKKGTKLGGKYGTKVALNLASWYNLPGSYSFYPSNYEVEFFGVGKKYFSDYNFELKKKLSEKLHGGFTYINQYYNKRWLEGSQSNKPVKTNIFAAEMTYSLSDKQSIRVEGEHLWTKEDKKNWAGATVEYSLNQNLSFYVWDIYNYGNDDAKKQIHYYNTGGAYRFKSTRIALNYGRQRGGLVFVGGVCRFVPESTGFTLSLNTSF